MPVLSLSDSVLTIDLFGKGRMEIPSECYAFRSGVIFSFAAEVATFYRMVGDDKKIDTIKEYKTTGGCKRLLLSEGGVFGGVLDLRRVLTVYSQRDVIGKVDQVDGFMISDTLVATISKSRVSVRRVNEFEKIIAEFGNIFHFSVFGESLVLIQKSNPESDAAIIIIWSDGKDVFKKPLDSLVNVLVKSDMCGRYLFHITVSFYSSNSYYGVEEVQFYNGSKLIKVDVEDPPLFCDFIGRNQFVICSGPQPSGVKLYDYNCKVVNEFSRGFRNQVHFNTHHNLVAFCGFGSLAGEIEIYDVEKKRKLCSFDRVGASLFSWSPCGSYFIVSTTRTMMQDNGVVLYDYFGREISRNNCDRLDSSEWVGKPEPFKVINEPNKLNVKEEPAAYVISEEKIKDIIINKSNLAYNYSTHPKARRITSPPPSTKRVAAPDEWSKRKTVVPPASRRQKTKGESDEEMTKEMIISELELIKDLKRKRDNGVNLSTEEWNKLFKEQAFEEKLKRLK